MNKKPLQHCLITLVALLVTVSAGWSQPERRYIQLTILHTNDTHAHLMPFSYPQQIAEEQRLPAFRNVGGIARRATLIKQIEAQRPGDVLVLDAGDVLDGSPYSVEFAGEADIAAMNAIGYDAMATGNHEYNNTFKDFNKRIQQAKFPLLGANVFRPGESTPLLTPYVIKTEEGLRIAILGLTTQWQNYTSTKEAHLVIKDPVEIAKQWVPKLREQADVVVLLTHIGHDEDRQLAAQVPGIDAIIGGHSHTRVEKPVLVKQTDDLHAFWLGGTVVTQDYQWGGELGRMDLIFHKNQSGWSLMSYKGGLIPITSEVPEDPQVHAVVAKYHQKIAAKYDGVIGQAAEDITGEAAYNLVSDALRESYNADFAVHNYGGVRTDLVQGPITFADLTEMLPFSNSANKFSVSGKLLKEILLQQPAVSNIQYQLKDGKLVSAKIGGKIIDDEAVYTGITHSFFAENSLPKGTRTTQIAPQSRSVVMEYIRKKKIIKPDTERRAIF